MSTSMIKKNGSHQAPASTMSTWVDQLFQDNLNRFFSDDPFFTGSGTGLSRIPVNLRETAKTYEMELIAPGLKKDDFRIQVSNDSLTVSFEHKQENQEGKEDEGWIRREFRNESFSRSFHLDDSVDVNKIEADYSNGILHVCLPKKENAQRISRNIEVK